MHERDYDPAAIDIIVLDGRDIGILRVRRELDSIHLDQILILPLYQRHGYGSELIRNLFEECRAASKPLRLQYLTDNPVSRLYERLRFRKIGESPPHSLAEWSPTA